MVHLAHEGGLTLDKGWNEYPPYAAKYREYRRNCALAWQRAMSDDIA